MNIEHCIFLSWFTASPESHEQDGEKLSRVAAMRRKTASGDPAMAFRTLPCRKGDPYRPLPFTGRAFRRRLNERTRPRVALRIALGQCPARKNHRRMPSFSIKFL